MTKKSHWLLKSLCCGLFFLAAVSPGKASVIYAYTGSAFTTFTGNDNSSTETDLSVQFTVPTALGPTFDGFVDPEAWEISDGSNTLTNTSPDLLPVALDTTGSFFDVETNGAGQIIAWIIDIVQNPDPLDVSPTGWLQLETANYPALQFSADESVNCSTGTPGSACTSYIGGAAIQYPGAQPGFTGVPEPRLTVLVGALLLAMFVFRARKVTA